MENSGYLSEKRLKEIEAKLEHLLKERFRQRLDPESIVMDNSDFIMHLKISLKTATIWRKQGKIPYSKINQKIYYKLSDIKKLIEDHKVRPVNKKKPSSNQ